MLANAAKAMELGFLEDESIDAILCGCARPARRAPTPSGEVLSDAANPSGWLVDTYPYEVEGAPSYYAFGTFGHNNVNYVNKA